MIVRETVLEQEDFQDTSLQIKAGLPKEDERESDH